MNSLPIIYTDRLTLGPFQIEDAPVVQHLAGEWEIADTTLAIPHPYPDGAAEAWIMSHAEVYSDGREIDFAIRLSDSAELVGAISLMKISTEHWHAELGYWIGKPYWNKGYCSEAASAVIQFAFNDLQLHRVHCYHFTRNPASGKVMQKIGMKKEGHFRQFVFKNDKFEDVDYYAALSTDEIFRLQK